MFSGRSVLVKMSLGHSVGGHSVKVPCRNYAECTMYIHLYIVGEGGQVKCLCNGSDGEGWKEGEGGK